MDAAERLYLRLGWIPRIGGKFLRHRDAGQKVLAAMGSLSVHTAHAARREGGAPDGLLLATEMVVDGDTLTGEMPTPSCT